MTAPIPICCAVRNHDRSCGFHCPSRDSCPTPRPGSCNKRRYSLSALASARPSDRRSSGSSGRSEEHTSELQSLMRISYAVFCLKKKKNTKVTTFTRLSTKTSTISTIHNTNYTIIKTQQHINTNNHEVTITPN